MALAIKPQTARERLIVALDVPTFEEASVLIKELRADVGLFKVGLELYAHCGTKLFEFMKSEGLHFFFDCKFLDIPNTVARASQALIDRNIAMFNVHALGGIEMMRSAALMTRQAAAEAQVSAPKIIAVTLLTSLGDKELAEELGITKRAPELVVQLATLAKQAGLDGVVASAQEITMIKERCGSEFLIVTPGIRPAWSAANDQKRIVTPRQAIQDGADYLVIGRPITHAQDRRDAARRIVEEMES